MTVHLIFDRCLILLIVLNVIAIILQSVDTINAEYFAIFNQFSSFSYIVFSIEYVVRIYRCLVNDTAQQVKPIARLRLMMTTVMLIDAVVLLLFYLKISIGIDPRLLRMFRVVSILQVFQNSRALQILQTIIIREKRTLLSALFIMLVLVIFEASIIYALEHKAQPTAFSSIPQAIWWTITTLTTVGYGDIVPITALGKFFGIIVMFIGVAMFAIPTGILVSAFYQEIKRKDFIATWDLVAQVPSFANLTATEIAQIADLLSLHVVRPGEVIFHKGDQADCMYFIVDGKVEINKSGKISTIEGGDFFGEIGVLFKRPRNANVTAQTYTELLMLNSRDIELFMEFDPQLRKRILEVSETRRK